MLDNDIQTRMLRGYFHIHVRAEKVTLKHHLANFTSVPLGGEEREGGCQLHTFDL